MPESRRRVRCNKILAYWGATVQSRSCISWAWVPWGRCYGANMVVHGNPSLRQYEGCGVRKPLAQCEAMVIPLCTEMGRGSFDREEPLHGA